MTHRLGAAVLVPVTLLVLTLTGACYRTVLAPVGLKDTGVDEESEEDVIEAEHDVQPDPSSDNPDMGDTAEEPDMDDAEEPEPSLEELTWDDGSCEMINGPGGDYGPGGMIAACFTPPSYPCRLHSATFLVANIGYPETEFGVRLFRGDGFQGRPRTVISIPATRGIAGPGGGWVDVDLFSLDVTIDSGDFCVAMEWLTPIGTDIYDPDAQALCSDNDSPDPGRSWIRWPDMGPWYDFSEIGIQVPTDVMIRAFVEVD